MGCQGGGRFWTLGGPFSKQKRSTSSNLPPPRASRAVCQGRFQFPVLPWEGLSLALPPQRCGIIENFRTFREGHLAIPPETEEPFPSRYQLQRKAPPCTLSPQRKGILKRQWSCEKRGSLFQMLPLSDKSPSPYCETTKDCVTHKGVSYCCTCQGMVRPYKHFHLQRDGTTHIVHLKSNEIKNTFIKRANTQGCLGTEAQRKRKLGCR